MYTTPVATCKKAELAFGSRKGLPADASIVCSDLQVRYLFGDYIVKEIHIWRDIVLLLKSQHCMPSCAYEI